MGRTRTGTVIWRGKVPYARVQWSDENGRRRQKEKKADNKTHARRLIKNMLRDLDDHGPRSLDRDRMTFRELADIYQKDHLQPAQYVDGRKVSGLRSLHTQKYTINVVREYFGNRNLRSITYGDIDRFRIDRINTPTKHSTPRSVTTVNRELEMLRNMFTVACREGWLLRNPFTCGTALIQKSHESKRERILTMEEENRLLKACTERRSHIRPIIVMALDTGMRQGELLKLKWEDIDLENKIVHVQAFNTKTMKERWLAMTPRIHRELSGLYERSTKNLEDLVFGIRDNVKKAFMSARKSAGLGDVRFHDLRHTAATRLVQGHVPLSEVGRVLGHTQANTTYRYVNANIETARRAADVLASFSEQKDADGQPVVIN